MTESEILRKAAALMERDGFSPEYRNMECGCFILRLDQVCPRTSAAWGGAADRISGIVGSVHPDRLRLDGWNTNDAVAALSIAADLAEAEGK